MPATPAMPVEMIPIDRITIVNPRIRITTQVGVHRSATCLRESERTIECALLVGGRVDDREYRFESWRQDRPV